MNCIADGLFTSVSGRPRLLGARCAVCAAVTFPAQDRCQRCGADSMDVLHLAERGRLWTWTTQTYRPKSPPYIGADPFVPFALGYVELPDGVLVETRLVVGEHEQPRIGAEMELCLVPFQVDGGEVMTFAFRPVQEVS
ncbi:putative OB-fold protein [Kibdelosporangium banguiense]|uniref:OB-fold protein n=1 Tax=Kibdelosporangium banguiense TaxID=1365924 RepID=A0ABS4TUF5_9PSEU|nr:OB-fold domain-containing protein [Kibdelosporangium banguiense]MBP2328051.1 putative OB-fold protein [Kibdelosporangium banguiense]